MDLVFKVTQQIAAGRTETVGDTNFKESMPTVHKNMAWATLKPLAQQATENFVVKFIGSKLYDDLAAKYQADTTLDANQAKTLRLVQEAAAYYTAWHAACTLLQNIADMGTQQQHAKEGTSGPPTQWAFKNSVWHYCETADLAMEKLLYHLEEMVQAGETYFDLWKTSNEYTFQKSCFFRNVKDLECYLEITGSWRTFKALTKYLKDAEKHHVMPVLCQEEFENLKAKVQAGEVDTEPYKTLLEYVREVVANNALFDAVELLSLKISDDGFNVISRTDGFDIKKNAANSTHYKMQERLKYAADSKAKRAKADLIQFLYNNADQFPLWKASACYRDPTTNSCEITYSRDRRGGIGLFKSTR